MTKTIERDVTQLLTSWAAGETESLDRLLPLVLDQLRSLAEHHLRTSPDCPTLQPTALVNEAYLRLVGASTRSFETRTHFFAFASKVMRELLLDYVRSSRALKRGGSEPLRPLEDVLDAVVEIRVDADTLLALHAALEKLERLNARQARLIELRYFGGLTFPEIAEVLGVSQATLHRDWAVSRRWLQLELQRGVASEEI